MTDSYFIYESNSNTTLIGILANTLPTIVFPKEIEEIIDFEIGKSLLTNCTGQNLEISFQEGSQVEYIGNCSFSISNYLTKADLSNCLELKSLSSSLFYNSSLQTILLPMNGTLEIIYSGCFKLTKITNISIPDSVLILDSYTFADGGVFDMCVDLTSINIEPTSKLQSIGYALAQYSSVSSFFIPSMVSSISYGAFSEMVMLESLKVDQNNTYFCSIEDMIYYKNKTILHTCAARKQTNITFTDEITKLGEEAFRTCLQTCELIIPESITEIPRNAFFNSHFSSIILHSNIESISSFAFCQSEITKITIPPSVTSIGTNAFQNSKIENVIFNASQHDVTVGDFSFADCANLVSIQLLHKGVVFSSSNVFSNSPNLKNINYIIDIPYYNDVFQETVKLNLIVNSISRKSGRKNLCGIIPNIHMEENICKFQQPQTCNHQFKRIHLYSAIFIFYMTK